MAAFDRLLEPAIAQLQQLEKCPTIASTVRVWVDASLNAISCVNEELPRGVCTPHCQRAALSTSGVCREGAGCA